MVRRAPRKYTPEQEIINLRAKGEITPKEAQRRLKQLSKEEEAYAKQLAQEEETYANRGIFRRVLDFMTP